MVNPHKLVKAHCIIPSNSIELMYVFIIYPISAFIIWHECNVLHKRQIQIYHSDFIN